MGSICEIRQQQIAEWVSLRCVRDRRCSPNGEVPARQIADFGEPVRNHRIARRQRLKGADATPKILIKEKADYFSKPMTKTAFSPSNVDMPPGLMPGAPSGMGCPSCSK